MELSEFVAARRAVTKKNSAGKTLTTCPEQDNEPVSAAQMRAWEAGDAASKRFAEHEKELRGLRAHSESNKYSLVIDRCKTAGCPM